MGPHISPVAQLLDQRALGTIQSLAKNVVPRLPHDFEEGRHIPVDNSLLAYGPVVTDEMAGLVRSLGLV